MYDKDACKAGIGLCMVVGGTVIAGWWVLAIALLLVGVGLIVGRAMYRHAQQDDADDE